MNSDCYEFSKFFKRNSNVIQIKNPDFDIDTNQELQVSLESPLVDHREQILRSLTTQSLGSFLRPPRLLAAAYLSCNCCIGHCTADWHPSAAEQCGNPLPRKTCGRRNLNQSRVSSAPRQKPPKFASEHRSGERELRDDPEEDYETMEEGIVLGKIMNEV